MSAPKCPKALPQGRSWWSRRSLVLRWRSGEAVGQTRCMKPENCTLKCVSAKTIKIQDDELSSPRIPRLLICRAWQPSPVREGPCSAAQVSDSAGGWNPTWDGSGSSDLLLAEDSTGASTFHPSRHIRPLVAAAVVGESGRPEPRRHRCLPRLPW